MKGSLGEPFIGKDRSMLTYLLLIGFWLPMPTLASEFLRMPVTHVVPLEQRVMQMETGCPAKALRRSRLELLKASLGPS